MKIDYKDSKYVFVFGIGGSNLASKAVWSAILKYKTKKEKEVFFVESPDNREFSFYEKLIENEVNQVSDFVFFVISKSGNTKEVLYSSQKILSILAKKLGEKVYSRGAVITTKPSDLSYMAENKKIDFIPWENDVGGRWSAFTVAHTLVLDVLGIDSEAFVLGGKKMNELDAKNQMADNLAKQIFSEYNHSVNILDFFFFNEELECVGKWARQLIGESLGKENIKGVKVGILPTVSIGPTDLHSMLQLSLGGPNNRFTIFVKSKKDTSSVNEKAFFDTVSAYKGVGLKYYVYEMEEINEEEMGKFMMFMMLATLELGKLLQVDPYGQKEVEEYKSKLKNQN